MARRDEEQRKRRRKRLQHGQRRARGPSLRSVLGELKEALGVPSPAHWPGASEPALERPDLVKFDLSEFVSRREPGKSKLKQLENRFLKGPLSFLSDIDHWAMEEFLYHGAPGDSWHPIEALLAREGDRSTPTGQEQLRRWKEARVGLFVLGAIRDGTIELQEWDVLSEAAVGASLRAIALNVGGVNAYRDQQGKLTVCYVAPWAPEQGISCAMGYGLTMDRRDAATLAPFLGLRHPEIVAHAWPWNANRSARQLYHRQWDAREWQGWLRDRLEFPFHAVVPLPPSGKRMAVKLVKGLVPGSPTQARQVGIYREIPMGAGTELMIAGATTIKLLDLTSPNLAPLTEYQTYREWAGPPPGTVGQPRFTTIE
jgi:hypothetical protein